LIETAAGRALAHAGAEPGHDHRVGAQVVEDVRAGVHRLDGEDLGEHRGVPVSTGSAAGGGASAVARLLIVGCW
jgi:hypothetical protein